MQNGTPGTPGTPGARIAGALRALFTCSCFTCSGLISSGLICSGLICCGCAESLPVASVSGTITYEGQPLVGASITTQPRAMGNNKNPGSGSWGKTNSEGKYQLEVVEPAIEGAVIGTHNVTISRASSDEEDPWSDDPNVTRDRKWPERFTNGSLSLEIPEGGRNDADFHLTAK